MMESYGNKLQIQYKDPQVPKVSRVSRVFKELKECKHELALLKQGWDMGALKMRENLEKVITDAQVRLNNELKQKANGKPLPDLTREQTEQLVKLFILTETGAIQREYPETRGFLATNYLYKQMKPRVEEKSNIKLLRNQLPYPSFRLNCENPGEICDR